MHITCGPVSVQEHPSQLHQIIEAMVRIALVAVSCFVATVTAARPLLPFGVTLPPRGGAGAVADFAGMCEAVKSSIVEKAGQSVSLVQWLHTLHWCILC